MRTRLYIAVASVAFIIILGCTGPDGLDSIFDNNGSGVCLEDSPDMEGTWVITGSGSRICTRTSCTMISWTWS